MNAVAKEFLIGILIFFYF